MLAMGRLGPATLALAFVLIAPGRASADIVARGVHDGSLALDAKGTPYVAYMHGKSLLVATGCRKDANPTGSRHTILRMPANDFIVGSQSGVELSSRLEYLGPASLGDSVLRMLTDDFIVSSQSCV